MPKKVAFLHTVTGVVDGFKKLCQEWIPHAAVCHIADEGLIQAALAAGGLTPAIYRRVCDHVVAAEQTGADVIQFTCSSISPCADVAARLVAVPVLKVDEPMIEQAVLRHERIGLLATACSTLTPSAELVRDKARQHGRSVSVLPVLCEGAFDAFLAGDLTRHDAIVRADLLGLMNKVEVVLLAQASIGRIVETLGPGEKTVPVLASPRPAMERLAKVLAR